MDESDKDDTEEMDVSDDDEPTTTAATTAKKKRKSNSTNDLLKVRIIILRN